MVKQLTQREADCVRAEVARLSRDRANGNLPLDAYRRHPSPWMRILACIDIHPVTGCWEWMAAISSGSIGYGSVKVGGKTENSHKFFRQWFFGPVPEGLCVRHSCDNPRCVCPDHLGIGSAQQNTDDMIAAGRGRGNMKPFEALLITFLSSTPDGYEGPVPIDEVAKDMSVSEFACRQIMKGKRHAKVTGKAAA